MKLRATLLCLLVSAAIICGQASKRQSFQLLALAPEFWQLFDKDAALATYASGFGFTEGPVWDKAGFLFVSDEEKNKIFRVYRGGRMEEFVSLGDPDGNTADSHGNLIDCASVLRAIIRINPDGSHNILADRFEGRRFNSPNDVIFGPDGKLYFTDPTLDLPKGEKQEIPFQGIYSLDRAGTVRLLSRSMPQPNGLAFSPDGQHLYVDDSESGEIRTWEVRRDGALSQERVFGREKEPGGVPDGMKVDRAGNLFVVGPRGIWIWSAQGKHLGTVIIPEQPANLQWGDADRRGLYITATTSVYYIRTKGKGFIPDPPQEF